jgi:hypothetical protein
MLKWLRDKLRKWLAEEPKVDALECLIEGKIKRVAVESVCGMSLMVTDGTGTWLVCADQCLNKHDFWAAWEQRNRDEFVWDDGTPFKPEGTK